MQSSALNHACEYETSMMLHLFPERVHLERAVASEPQVAEPPARGVSFARGTHFLSANGASGRPDLASAEKGEYLTERASEATIAFLRDFKDWPLLEDLRQSV